ncbi:MAG: hypothetical protein FJ146_09560 [Deltaproteobacteria bacterium]|nr:hypothetical protein [Deltaproteobacteria bacterium]
MSVFDPCQKANKPLWQVGQILVFLLPAFVLAGCAYRFTNRHVKLPAGVHSVAVEAVFDTSQEVLPHEMLWQSLQRAFAADGHWQLVSQSQADALVRAHVRAASVTAVGTNLDNDLNSRGVVKVKDPEAFDGGPPPVPSDFNQMTQAGKFRDQGTLTTVVEVEAWNLSTRQLIARKVYPVTSGFRALHAASGVTTKFNDHLRYEEATREAFLHMSDGIAKDFVRTVFMR